MNPSENTARACPSAPCRNGAAMFGVIGGRDARRRVIYLRGAVPVPEALLDAERDPAAAPEMYLRFSDTCLEGGCAQWQGRCRLIERELRDRDVGADLVAARADCPIRLSCRWAAQEGGRACIACEQMATLGYDHVALSALEIQPREGSVMHPG